MATKTNKQQFAVRCIFCSNTGVTKQHIWPDQLKKILPRVTNKHDRLFNRVNWVNKDGKVYIQPHFESRQGALGVRTVKNVCEACNSGWINIAENAAMVSVKNLIQGQAELIGAEDVKNILRWICIVTIMAEYIDPYTLSIPPIDRLHIYEGGFLPSNWKIWLGKSSHFFHEIHYAHRGIQLALQRDVIDILEKRKLAEYNTQISVFGLGHFVVNVFSSTTKQQYYLPPIQQRKFFEFSGMDIARGFNKTRDIDFKRVDYITNDDFDIIKDHYLTIVKGPNGV
jgi:hypothetical protein